MNYFSFFNTHIIFICTIVCIYITIHMCNMRNCDKSNGLLLSLGATNYILGKCAKSLSGKMCVTNGTTYDMVCNTCTQPCSELSTNLERGVYTCTSIMIFFLNNF